MSSFLVDQPGVRAARGTIEAPAAPAPAVERLRSAGEPVTGIVLAGGRSERMGRDKAWVEMAGRPLIRWVLDAVQTVTTGQIVVARGDQRGRGRLEALGVPVVVDRFPARGPLTGIHAGLRACPTDLAVVVACDLPLVRPALLALLVESIGAWDAAVPYIGEGRPPEAVPASLGARQAGLQPLAAAYRRACVAPLEKLLAAGPVPTTALISVIRARIIHPEIWRPVDPDGRSFFNVNTHEDLFRATRKLGSP